MSPHRPQKPHCDRLPLPSGGGDSMSAWMPWGNRTRLVAATTGPHIGGLTPRPTLMRDACSVPSGCLVAAAIKTRAPGLSSLLSVGVYATMGVSDGTTIFFSPSLYLRFSTLPSLEAPLCATLPFVIVLDGCRSQ